MKHLKKPGTEGTLFDMGAYGWWNRELEPSALKRLEGNWQGVFRRTILALMEKTAKALGSKFTESIGRPTKELYAMSGFLLIAEFKNWTIEEAAEAWTLDAGVQYALGLSRKEYLSERTVDNYRRNMRENVDTQDVFTTVTS